MKNERVELNKANKKFVYSTFDMLQKINGGDVRPLEYKKGNEEITKILVSGANGWLGRHLVDELLTMNVKIVAPIRAKNQKEAEKKVEEFKWGGNVKVIAIENLSNLLDMKVDSVIHCAGDMSLAKTLDEMWDSNVKLVMDMYEWALKNKAKSFHHISTLSTIVASDRDGGVVGEGDSLDMMSRLFGGYGASKWCAEAWLNKMGRENDSMEVAIHRPGLLSWSKTRGWNESDGIYNWVMAQKMDKIQIDEDKIRGEMARVDWSETSEVAEGIVKSVMDSHLGVFHWANKQNITFNMLRGLIEKEGKVEKREVDDGKVIKNVQRALARFVDRERWERYWWHDLFQSSHHFFDAQNANRIQRQQTLKIKELIKAIKEV